MLWLALGLSLALAQDDPNPPQHGRPLQEHRASLLRAHRTLEYTTMGALALTAAGGVIAAINKPTLFGDGKCASGDPIFGDYGCERFAWSTGPPGAHHRVVRGDDDRGPVRAGPSRRTRRAGAVRPRWFPSSRDLGPCRGVRGDAAASDSRARTGDARHRGRRRGALQRDRAHGARRPRRGHRRRVHDDGLDRASDSFPPSSEGRVRTPLC
jgi:hypothetical protein